jgi:hypothetical protein
MRVCALILGVLSFVGGFASIGLAAANKEEFELQERCGKLAAQYFHEEYGEGVVNNDYVDPDTHRTLYDQTRSTFVNHYGARENRCFVIVTTTNVNRFEQTENASISIMLIDINGHHNLGMFHAVNHSTTPDICFVGHRDCQSMDEWNLLLQPYMSE